MQAPPLVSKKLQTPLETHLLTTIDPPWPKARVGSGIWRLMQPLPVAEGHAHLCRTLYYYYHVRLWVPVIRLPACLSRESVGPKKNLL